MRQSLKALVVLFASLSAGSLQELDESLYSAVRDGLRCDLADAYFSAASFAGGTECHLAANLALACFGDERMRQSAKLASAALGVGMLTTQLLKCAVGRERPEGQKLPRCRSSFPSGHATAAFAAAYVYGSQYPKLRVPLYIFAVSVALSRVYLGEHYPSDVLAGAAIGTAAGIVVVKSKNFVLALGL